MEDSALLYYVIGIIISIAVMFFLFRWIFSVEKRIKQNASIINLLALIAKKQGATKEEINNAVK